MERVKNEEYRVWWRVAVLIFLFAVVSVGSCTKYTLDVSKRGTVLKRDRVAVCADIPAEFRTGCLLAGKSRV